MWINGILTFNKAMKTNTMIVQYWNNSYWTVCWGHCGYNYYLDSVLRSLPVECDWIQLFIGQCIEVIASWMWLDTTIYWTVYWGHCLLNVSGYSKLLNCFPNTVSLQERDEWMLAIERLILSSLQLNDSNKSKVSKIILFHELFLK